MARIRLVAVALLVADERKINVHSNYKSFVRYLLLLVVDGNHHYLSCVYFLLCLQDVSASEEGVVFGFDDCGYYGWQWKSLKYIHHFTLKIS